MAPTFRHTFTVEGRPFSVRHDRIVAIGLSPTFGPEQIDPDTGRVLSGQEPTLVTVMFIDGMGNMGVDEDYSEAMDIWESSVV